MFGCFVSLLSTFCKPIVESSWCNMWDVWCIETNDNALSILKYFLHSGNKPIRFSSEKFVSGAVQVLFFGPIHRSTLCMYSGFATRGFIISLESYLRGDLWDWIQT